MPPQDEYLIDLDAFAPAPGRTIKFRGRLYPVRNFNDVPLDDALLLLRAEQELQGKTPREQLELGLRYMQILVPDMDRATLGTLSASQILLVVQGAMGAAEVPPMAGAAPSASGTNSPASAGSTGGDGPRSAA
ncbi:MAG: hypothetical protein ACE147_00655 [Candidatus Methylomirabilales bacterium]